MTKIWLVIMGVLILWSTSQDKIVVNREQSLEEDPANEWVDSVMNEMTLEQKIAQCIMIPVYSNKDKAYEQEVDRIVQQYQPGGMCFFQGEPIHQLELNNRWQKQSAIPMMVSMDAEWGPGMRLQNTISFPRQMTLGAIQDEKLIYEMGVEIAKQLRRLNVHMNFAPVADVNNNSKNPVINSRSFGENPANVATKSIAYMKGMQDNYVLACAKHFPGHGDTDKDSHYTLPLINKSANEIDSIHLFPFKELIKHNIASIMVAHLHIPALESEKNNPTTLSYAVITELLKEKLGFNALIITDALGMQGVADYNTPGQLEVDALKAGNDILLMPANIATSITAIKKAIETQELELEEIEKKCRKILKIKYWLDLREYRALKTDSLIEYLNRAEALFLKQKLYENAITLVKNENNLLPLRDLEKHKIASVVVGTKENDFQEYLSYYAPVDHFYLSRESSVQEQEALLSKLKDYSLVILGLLNTNNSAKNNYGIRKSSYSFIEKLQRQNKIILNFFANPYSLDNLIHTENIESIIVSYEEDELAQKVSAQAIFGGIAYKGKLPVTASPRFPLGTGIETQAIRMKFTWPEELGIASADLYAIDSLVLDAIKEKALPGCQILLSKEGKVFFYKSYGYHTYDKKIPVKNTDIYDLASLTKILATTPMLMKLSDEGLFSVDSTMGTYLPALQQTDKKDLEIKKVLTHTARLRPWIPFFLETIKEGEWDNTIYNAERTDEFCVQVCDNMYINPTYKDTICEKIYASKYRTRSGYRYSDLGFYMFMLIIEDITGKSFSEAVNDAFYRPLGLPTMCFNPLLRFSKDRIPPTEDDKTFRKQLVHAYVHDQGAAMLGGVCGHAGLFSSAIDVAILMQVYIQMGEYSGIRFFRPQTIKQFTSYQYPRIRRGLGFDKPLRSRDGGPTHKLVSDQSYGHSGFTGTYTWADPEYDLVYVFLSNRVYPDAENRKIAKMDLRTNIHKVVYKALQKN